MDLLFSRYASPFLLLDNLILTQSLTPYIEDLYEQVAEDKNWEFFLHKVYDQSWAEFKGDMQINSKHKDEDSQKIDLGATLMKSKNMLNNFVPKGDE